MSDNTPIPCGGFTPKPTDMLHPEQIDDLKGRAHQAVAQVLADPLTPERLAQLRQQVNTEIRSVVTTFHDHTNHVFRVACAAGCNHCCTIPVSVRPHEVFALMWWFEQTYTPEQQAVSLVTVRERNHAMLSHTPQTRLAAGILCGLNGPDGSCLVYPVQPMPCAQYTSFDVGKCRFARNNGNQYPIDGVANQYEMFQTVGNATTQAFFNAGLPIDLLEITAAIVAYLDTPDAWDIWYTQRRNPFPNAVWTLRGTWYDDGTPIAEQSPSPAA